MNFRSETDIVDFSNRRWKNRRRMAWLTLGATLCYTFIMMILPSEKIAALAAISSYFYVFAGGVVGSYIGFATLGDKHDMDNISRLDSQQ